MTTALSEALRLAWRRVAENPYQAAFWAYVTIALVLLTFLVPPFQKSDEPSHYFRAVSLTNLDFTCSEDESGRQSFAMKLRYALLPDLMHTFDVAFRYDAKFDTSWLRQDFSDPALNEPVRVYDICNLPPLGYLPNSAGILVGKPFTNPLVGFYLARAFGALFFCGAVVAALRISPERYRLLVYLYAALPMVLHQVGGVTYDAVQLSLWPLLFAFVTKFATPEEPMRRSELLLFCGLLLWAVNVRSLAYAPLLLLVLLIPPARVAAMEFEYRRFVAGFLTVAGVTTAALAALYLGESSFLAPDAVGISASSQIRFVLENPWHFAAAAYRTLQLHGELLLRQGIGVFGWIDYSLNFVPYYAAVVTAGLVANYAAGRDVLVLTRTQIAVLWLALGGTVLALFLSLYAVWSPVGAGVIGGLQGRYFIGLLPFAILAISQTALAVGRRRSLAFLTLLLGLFVLASIFRAIVARYY
jgi:uncharacterized membrane protein